MKSSARCWTRCKIGGGWENSLLIFCSDHGEMLGDHGLAYKWLMYDPIVHIPLMIRTPQSVDRPGETRDLVSLMDLGPTILEAAGVAVPTYLEGRSLMPYLNGETPVPRDYVFCEDNYQIMMRSQTHKMVYYIGQAEGELYDLSRDPGELWNLWDKSEYADVKGEMFADLLSWMTTSNYYNAGYKRQRSKQYRMRWPSENDAYLHGAQRTTKTPSCRFVEGDIHLDIWVMCFPIKTRPTAYGVLLFQVCSLMRQMTVSYLKFDVLFSVGFCRVTPPHTPGMAGRFRPSRAENQTA